MADDTIDTGEREDALHEAVKLNDLVTWIGQARDLIDEIRDAAAIEGSAMAAALNKRSIAYLSPDWYSRDAGEGLAYLLQRQRKLIKSLN